MQAEGYHVLWRTHHCHWVARQPAVGLHVEPHATPPYSTTQIEDRFYSVKEGVLEWDPQRGMVGGRRRPALAHFLDDYASGAVHWGLRTTDTDGRR